MGIKEKIENWSVERSIDGYENRFQQLVKLSEEVGELSGKFNMEKERKFLIILFQRNKVYSEMECSITANGLQIGNRFNVANVLLCLV